MSAGDGTDATQLYQDALEALPEAIAIFDRDDRFVFWNRRFDEIYGEGVEIRVGTRFADHLRDCLNQGLVPDAIGRENEWLAGRLARFAKAEGAYEHRLANGRWVRVQDRRLAHGGRIGIRADITEAMEREHSFRLLFDGNPVPMFVSGLHDFKIRGVNDAAVAFYGYAREAFLRLSIHDIRPERSAGEIAAFIQHRLSDNAPVGAFITHRTAAGEDRPVHVTLRRLDYDGVPCVLAGIFDLTEKVRMEEEIDRTRNFLTQVVDHVPTPMFAKDMHLEGRYVIYNRASEMLFGRTRADVIGQTDADVFDPAAVAMYRQQDQSALTLGLVESSEDELFRRQDGTTRSIRTRKVALAHHPEEQPRFVLGVSEDVTERRASEARIAHMAHHDGLTDLPNRFLFQDRLVSALAGRRPGTSLAVMFLDLDGFKSVNDTHGHAAGDALLRQVAERLRASLRSGDTAARFGGDEFAVLQTIESEPGETALLAGQLKATLGRPYQVGARSVRVSVSIGIALAPFDAEEPGALLEQADAALYRAKRSGRDRFCFTDPASNAQARPERMSAHGSGSF